MIEWIVDNIAMIAMINTFILSVITIFAIFRAPIVALEIQKKIEKIKEKEERKFNIFKTLLATRANALSLEHVQALNLIDLEFYNEKEIREAWNVYRDHLNSYPKTNEESNNKSTEDRWQEKSMNCLIDLLYSLSKYFGYDFDKVLLKNGAYSPNAHAWLELEQKIIRQGFVSIFAGDKAFKVKLT